MGEKAWSLYNLVIDLGFYLVNLYSSVIVRYFAIRSVSCVESCVARSARSIVFTCNVNDFCIAFCEEFYRSSVELMYYVHYAVKVSTCCDCSSCAF